MAFHSGRTTVNLPVLVTDTTHLNHKCVSNICMVCTPQLLAPCVQCQPNTAHPCKIMEFSSCSCTVPLFIQRLITCRERSGRILTNFPLILDADLVTHLPLLDWFLLGDFTSKKIHLFDSDTSETASTHLHPPSPYVWLPAQGLHQLCGCQLIISFSMVGLSGG